MVQDVAPALLEKILKDLRQGVQRSEKIHRVDALIEQNKAVYRDAYSVASEIGAILMQSFAKHLSSDVLPDGKMYYNIANRVLRIPLEEADSIIFDYTAKIQQQINDRAGYGIKAII